MSEIKILKNKAYTQVSATGGERELDFGFPLFSSAHIKLPMSTKSPKLEFFTPFTIFSTRRLSWEKVP